MASADTWVQSFFFTSIILINTHEIERKCVIIQEKRPKRCMFINYRGGIMNHTRITKLLLEESTALLPVISSSSNTPNAKTSVFSFTTPCMKYSGAIYLSHRKCHLNIFPGKIKMSIQFSNYQSHPKVPSMGNTTW